jgi:hypothetical protein
MAALIAGERDPVVLANLARGSLRSKTDRLTEALTAASPSTLVHTSTVTR